MDEFAECTPDPRVKLTLFSRGCTSVWRELVATQDRDDVCDQPLLLYRCMYARRLTVVRQAHSGQPSTLKVLVPRWALVPPIRWNRVSGMPLYRESRSMGKANVRTVLG